MFDVVEIFNVSIGIGLIIHRLHSPDIYSKFAGGNAKASSKVHGNYACFTYTKS